MIFRFTTLLVNSADDKLIVFLCFPENGIWHLLRRQFAWNVKAHFLEKKIEVKKHISKCCLLEFLPSMLSIKDNAVSIYAVPYLDCLGFMYCINLIYCKANISEAAVQECLWLINFCHYELSLPIYPLALWRQNENFSHIGRVILTFLH